MHGSPAKSETQLESSSKKILPAGEKCARRRTVRIREQKRIFETESRLFETYGQVNVEPSMTHLESTSRHIEAWKQMLTSEIVNATRKEKETEKREKMNVHRGRARFRAPYGEPLPKRENRGEKGSCPQHMVIAWIFFFSTFLIDLPDRIAIRFIMPFRER